MASGLSYIAKPTGILKIVELIMVIIAFSLQAASSLPFSSTSIEATNFGLGVLVTGLFITPVIFISYLAGGSEMRKTIFEFVYHVLMFVFLLSAGSVAVNTYSSGKWFIPDKTKSEGLAMGSFCILASFVYLGDAVLNFMEYKKAD